MLTIRDSLPDEFLNAYPAELKSVLGGPTLIHLAGTRARPLFISILLHGNEITGLLAVQALLSRYQSVPLPRAVSIFIGNVEAARVGKRLLPGQRDYNRIWINASGAEHDMTHTVLEVMRDRDVFACIDIHNNTGKNPYYAIIAKPDVDHLKCAALFSNTVVYATCPDTTCTVAFSELCPSVTLEAGLPGDPVGVEQTVSFLETFLYIEDFGVQTLKPVNLFHTVAVVKVRDCCSYGFLGEDVDLQLVDEIDHYNFRELEPGTCLARVRNGDQQCLDVQHVDGRQVYTDYFMVTGSDLQAAKAVMPAMLTTNRDIISLDCLCYLMERLPQSELENQRE
jgi:succinylglutamate desuccinylase